MSFSCALVLLVVGGWRYLWCMLPFRREFVRVVVVWLVPSLCFALGAGVNAARCSPVRVGPGGGGRGRGFHVLCPWGWG